MRRTCLLDVWNHRPSHFDALFIQLFSSCVHHRPAIQTHIPFATPSAFFLFYKYNWYFFFVSFLVGSRRILFFFSKRFFLFLCLVGLCNSSPTRCLKYLLVIQIQTTILSHAGHAWCLPVLLKNDTQPPLFAMPGSWKFLHHPFFYIIRFLCSCPEVSSFVSFIMI